jgi:hypothetical protein
MSKNIQVSQEVNGQMASYDREEPVSGRGVPMARDKEVAHVNHVFIS